MYKIKQLQRLEQIHYLIENQKTGSPKHLAEKMGVCRSTIYELIDYLKSLDAPVKYSRIKESYYYCKPFNLEINVSIKVLNNNETKTIYGGFAPVVFQLPKYFL